MSEEAAGYAPGGYQGLRSAEIGPDLAEFLSRLDTFFFATASADGQPYVQHRGGPQGFLKPVGPSTLAFADYAGNRQYITIGNLGENARVMLLLIDFEVGTRIKVRGRARAVEGDAALLARLTHPGYRAKPERAIVVDVSAWEVNCRRHIAPRIREDEHRRRVAGLVAHIARLEAERAVQSHRASGDGDALRQIHVLDRV